MPFPSWRAASQLAQSSAFVLIVIGLGGFFVDLAVKPISSAGLVLLLLAATPSLVAIFRQRQAEFGSADDSRAKAPLAGVPQRAILPRGAQEGSRAAQVASPAQARDVRPDRVVPAGARGSSESRSSEPGRQAAAKGNPAPQPRDDQQRLAVSARGQRQADAEPVRQRAEAATGSDRRPGEPPRSHANAL